MRMTYGDWALLLLLSVLWGGAFFFAAFAVREVPPLTVVLARTSLAALTLAVVLRLTGERWPFRGGAIPVFLTMGLLNNLLPFSLLFWAQTEIPSGLASILNATTPIFTILIAHFALTDERMAPNKALGIAFGFSGVVVLLGETCSTDRALPSAGCWPASRRRSPMASPAPMAAGSRRWACRRCRSRSASWWGPRS